MDKGFVFVSTNYRLLPSVDMATIVRDVAKSIRWVHDHIAEYGGDPKRLFIMGHSAGAQLAALICTDDRYLKAEGLSLAIIKGCVPVDGDTYDVPAIIETAETRWRVHGLPQAKFGHREKFGNDPAKHRDFSAVTHVAKDKGIPPFLILHVAEPSRHERAGAASGQRAERRGHSRHGLRRQGDHPQQDQRGPRHARRSGHQGVVRVPRQGTEEVIACTEWPRPLLLEGTRQFTWYQRILRGRDDVSSRPLGLAVNGRDPEQASYWFSVGDVDALWHELDAKGIEPGIIDEKEYDGKPYRVFFAKEPYGVCFCFTQPLEPTESD